MVSYPLIIDESIPSPSQDEFAAFDGACGVGEHPDDRWFRIAVYYARECRRLGETIAYDCGAERATLEQEIAALKKRLADKSKLSEPVWDDRNQDWD